MLQTPWLLPRQEQLVLAAEPFSDVAGLRVRAQCSVEALTDATDSLSPDTMLTVIWRDEPYTLPAGVVQLQAINHATAHRAQMATILTQLGVTPPDMDGWTYQEEVSG